MGKWMAKAMMQGIISLLPGSTLINYNVQRYITRSLRVARETPASRLRLCVEHLNRYISVQGKLPRNVLELGTGWFPTVPLGLYLSGVELIYSIDIQPLIQPRYCYEMLRT